MKSTVYHYYGPKRKGRCCGQFTIKNWALTSAIYTLVRATTTENVRLLRSVNTDNQNLFAGDICGGRKS